MPTVHVLGAYRLEPTADLTEKAIVDKYGPDLTGRDRAMAEDAVQDELSNVVLLEIVIEGADALPDLGEFCQESSDQVLYDEHYLTEDGLRVVGDFGNEPSSSASYRVAFWLHYFDTNEPLVTPWGTVAVPTPRQMPERLAALMPYEPTD